MRRKSFEIALSAIATAIATIFLSLGTLTPFLLMTGFLLGTFSMMLPIAKEFPLGSFLAYVASSILTLFFGGIAYIWRVLPYLAFFGLHPLVNYLQLKFNVNRWLAYVIKGIWFDGMLALVWLFIAGGSSPVEFVNTYIVPIIAVGGFVVFYFYDYLIFSCQISVNRIVSKIKR